MTSAPPPGWDKRKQLRRTSSHKKDTKGFFSTTFVTSFHQLPEDPTPPKITGFSKPSSTIPKSPLPTTSRASLKSPYSPNPAYRTTKTTTSTTTTLAKKYKLDESDTEDERDFMPDSANLTFDDGPSFADMKPQSWIQYKSKEGEIILFNPVTKTARLAADETVEEIPQRGNKWVDQSKDGEVPEDEKMTLETVVDTLGTMLGGFKMIYDNDEHLSGDVVDSIKLIHRQMEEIHGSLEEGKMAFEEGNDVEVLLNKKKIDWNFSNEHVEWYRATVRQRCHDSYTYKSFDCPEYLSDFPIPPGSGKFKCDILLPQLTGAKNEKIILQPIKSVEFKTKDDVAKAIRVAYEKIKGRGAGKDHDYCLKAIGFSEFLFARTQFDKYSYVRHGLRENLKLSFRLVKIPDSQTNTSNNGTDKKENNDIKSSKDFVCDNKLIDIHTYSNLTLNKPWLPNTLTNLPISELDFPFRCKIIGIDRVNKECVQRLQDDYVIDNIYLEAFLFYGMVKILKTRLRSIPLTRSPLWNGILMGDQQHIFLNNLPRETRIGFILWGTTKSSEGDVRNVRLAWVVRQLVDQYGVFSTGEINLNLWALPRQKKGKHKERELDPDFIFRASNRDCHTNSQKYAILRLKFDSFMLPVVAPMCVNYRKPNVRVVGPKYKLTKKNKNVEELNRLIKEDSIYQLKSKDQQLIWAMRHHLVYFPDMLPKFLQCVNWGSIDHKCEAYRLLDLWSPPILMASVLGLLDVKFPDYRVREYAVKCLRRLKDDELQMYLLQFTQCLKFEPYHDSPLSRFLIERAIRNPYYIGHYFFWHLKAEIDLGFAERYSVILEEFLSNCGRFSGELRKQNFAVLKLQRVAGLIVRLKREEGFGDEAATKEYRRELHKLNRTFFSRIGKFQIPLDPRWEATELIVEKCKYMSSKMVPLWLVMKNADTAAPNTYAIFKSGDDLRQDILTLQLLRIMDRMWLADGLDMRLKPYKVIATGINDHGDGVGMIEVVLNSDTTSGIQLEYGGGALGALKLEPIDNFLRAHNTGAELYKTAVDNFVASAAGYCVATFVLGIGDRHNGNIMVTKDGHLFHIDFGHFLGNFKTKFGVNRERAAFVFTPEMAYVMGGKKYKKSDKFQLFMQLCTKAYLILRKNACIIESLFVLMVSAGMPELMTDTDVLYLKDKLNLHMTEKDATKSLRTETYRSLETTFRRFDNMIHNLKHG